MHLLKRGARRMFGGVVRAVLSERNKERLLRGTLAVMNESQRDDVSRRFGIASMEGSLRQLARLGLQPGAIVDVGAYQGEWTEMARAIFPAAHILMLEAQSAKEPWLQQVQRRHPQHVAYRLALLGPEAREAVPFFELETGSSVLEEQSHVPRTVTRRRMERLDDVIAETLRAPPDVLKLDVQGFELEVLRGAEGLLAQVQVVLTEVSLIPINRGAPLLHEVVRFMHDREFIAYDICSLTRRPLDGALWQTDMIFVRKGHRLVTNHCLGAD